MMRARNTQHGLTLVELLIALFVFALIASAGVYLMRLSIDGRGQLLQSDQVLREWQFARLIIRQDLTQIAPRRVRDEFGNRQVGAFVGGAGFSNRIPVIGETPLMGFVRMDDSLGDLYSPRPSLQYVEYVLKDDALIRRVRPYLDDARDQPRQDRVLISSVLDYEIGFLAGEGNRGFDWIEDWPAANSRQPPPRAIRIVIQSERLGEVEQLFWIGDLVNEARS